jgi:hypothetical protein
MLSVASTFTGHLATAEAIYDGPHDNLVGVETFSGSDDNKTALLEVTQHAIMNCPLPDHQPGEKHSPFTFLHTD